MSSKSWGVQQANPVSRRAILRTASVAATAVSIAMLEACGNSVVAPVAPTAPAATSAMPAANTAVAPSGVPTAAASAPSATSGGTSAAATVVMSAAAPATSVAATAPVAMDGKIPSPAPELGVPDAFTKLPTPFKAIASAPGKGGKVTAFLINTDPPLPPHDQNLYWQELEKRIGVSSYDATVVPDSGYEQKFAATIAGGDLPDLMFFNPPPGWEKIMQQGAFTDLTPYLTGDALKEFPNLAAFPAIVWKNVALNRKIYGVPRPRYLASTALYFRQDWAEKVGYGTQKNADDVFKMFVAMAKNDPDGNGKADTWGYSSNAPRPQFGVEFLAWMFRAPNNWRRNADGTLTKNYETDEYKATVDFARRLWAAGALHPDAANSTNTANLQLLVSGKIGAYASGISGLPGKFGARGTIRQMEPSANLIPWIPVGHDGGSAVYHKAIGFFGFTAIPAKVGKDQGRVKELLHILDYFAAPFGSEENTFLANGLEGVHFTYENGVPIKNARGRSEIGVVTGTQGVVLANLTNPPQVPFYDSPGDAQLIQQAQYQMLKVGLDDPTWGVYSPTNSQQSPVLAQLQADALFEVVTGRGAPDRWDTFVKDWRSRGGDQIRKEYEDALKGP